jgi:hypothetical protein
MSAAPQIAPLSLEAHAAAIARALGRGRETQSNGTWRTFCPAHDDGSPGLEVTIKNGKVLARCWNGGCSQDAIIAALKDRGLWPDRGARRRLTLAEFASAKKLPVEFLKANDVTEGHGQYGPVVQFRCRLEDGTLAPRHRVRVALEGPKKLFWDRVGKGGKITPYGLNRLPDARKRGLLTLVEGESDALTCWFHDTPALGLPGNTMTSLLTPAMLADITKLIISQEPGASGQKFRDDIVAKLKAFRWAGKVRIVHWPDATKDPSALHIADSEGFERKFAEMVASAELVDLSEQKRLPIVDADAYLPDVTKAAWAALRDANEASDPPRLYLHSGLLVRLEIDPDSGEPSLRDLTEARMRFEATDCSIWLKKQQTTPADPSKHQIENILATPNAPLPRLRRVTRVPIFAPTGALIDRPGFHAGILYLPDKGLIVPAVSKTPTRAEIERAKRWLHAMFFEFPFITAADRAHAIGLLILPFVRELIKGATPLHIFDAPQPRSGKSLLVEMLLYIGLGRNYAHYTLPERDEDIKKEITSALREGRQGILYDNIKYLLASGELCAALTKRFWDGRILGVSGNLKVEPLTTIWCASGNNVGCDDEIGPRSVRSRIDAHRTDPENRRFRKNLEMWVPKHRGGLIWSALTLIQFWFANGSRSPSVAPLGKFEEWSRVIGGVLEACGIPGFLSVRPSDCVSARDHETATWREFVARWWALFRSDEVQVAQLLEIARNIDGFWLGKSDDDSGKKRALGKGLSKRRDWTISPLKLDEVESTPEKVKLINTATTRKIGGWKLQPEA